MEIERVSASSWSLAAILEEFERQNGVQLIAVKEGDAQVVGWCCGRVIDKEAELLKITVDPGQRCQGIATALLGRLEKACADLGVKKLFLEVRASNQPARILYEKQGFHQLYKRKNYYKRPIEDAVIFEKLLV